MEQLITNPNQVTSDMLTEILHEKGYLLQGKVTTVEKIKSYQTPPSQITHLQVTYSDDAQKPAPTRLFLKIPKPERLPTNNKEVLFYNEVAATMVDSPSVHCYDAVYNSESRTIPWPISRKPFVAVCYE